MSFFLIFSLAATTVLLAVSFSPQFEEARVLHIGLPLFCFFAHTLPLPKHPCLLRGAMVTSLRGGWHHHRQQTPFVASASTA